MTDSLSEFNEFGTEEETIEDFVPAKQDNLTMFNIPSNLNYATNTALLGSGENLVENIRAISGELESGEGSITAEEIHKMVEEQQLLDARNALVNALVDPNLSDADKRGLTEAFLRTREIRKPVQQKVAQEATIAPSDGESTEQQIVRLNLADTLNEVDDFNKFVQSKYNQIAANSDAGFMDNVGDFVGLLMPYVESVKLDNLQKVLNPESGVVDSVQAVLLLGEAKNDIREAIRVMPFSDQLQVAQALSNLLGRSPGISSMDENDFIRLENFRTFLEEGYYETSDRLLDDFMSVLDTFSIGFATPVTSLWRGARAALRRYKTADDADNALTNKAIRSQTQSVTPANTLKDTNPSKARAAHEIAASDVSGESAQAAYGSNRNEAIADGLLPEVGNKSGVVRNKVGDIDDLHVKQITPDAKVADFANNDGMIYYSKAEKAEERSRIENDWRNATGIYTRNEMFQIQDRPNGVRISAVYGPKEGGWSKKEEALDLVKFGLKAYGVDEKNVQLLRYKGGDFIPWNPGDPDTGMYVVKVDMDYNFNPGDIVKWQDTDVKRNWFDYIGGFGSAKMGSLQRHLVDPHSMLDTRVTLGANVAVDKSIGLERALVDLSTKFSKGFAKLPKDRRWRVEALIVEANDRGLDLTENLMDAKGLTKTEKGLMRDWREAWDTHYWLENRDLAKTLRNQNWGMYVDSANETDLLVKKLPNKGFGSYIKVYDPVTDGIRVVKRDEITDLYKKRADGTRGSIAQLRDPIEIDGEFIDKIVVKETASDGYFRAINVDDKVLNYRKGYYQVHYKDPLFIVESKTDKNGRTIEKAIGTAPDTKTANLYLKRLESNRDPDAVVTYKARKDKKQLNMGGEDYWSLQTTAGRTAQRRRGERLSDGATIIDPQHQHLLDPVAALTKSIRSVSRRTSMRDYLDATKKRFVEQYGRLLPTNDFGQPVFPDDIKKIGKGELGNLKDEAGARTMFEYINYLENGYVNAIDEFWKGSLNRLADITGSSNLSRTERGLRAASELRPTSGAKGAAFKAYLALNPLRQLVVQAHQASRLTAIHPSYVLSGKMAAQFGVIQAARRGLEVPESLSKAAGMTRQEVKEAVEQFNKSGLAFAVDANNLVRSDLKKVADVNLGEKLNRYANMPIDFMQKIGFDTGEEANILTAWLAERNAAVSKGAKMDAESWDNIAANARNFTYNMNLAGDMPYNQNMFNVLAQFMQVPHKAVLQYTNRALTPAQKARVIAFDSVMFGMPGGAIASIFGPEVLPEDPELARAITNGFEEYAFNWVLSKSFGADIGIDFSGLAPTDLHGAMQLVEQIWSEPSMNVLAKSPAGQLFFGGNPRITNAFKTAAQFFHLSDDHDDPVKFSEMAMSFAKISSGFSNAYKAAFALEYGMKMNSLQSKVTDSNVHTVEAIAQALGFRTLDEAQRMKVSMTLYEEQKAFDDDVKKWYDFQKARLSNKSLTPEQLLVEGKSLATAFQVWEKTPRAYEVLKRLRMNDIKAGRETIFPAVMKAAGFMDEDRLKALIRDSGQAENKKTIQTEAVEFMKKNRNSE